MSSSSPAATSTSSNNTSSNQQGDVCLYVRRRDFQQIEKMLKQNPQKLTKQIRWVINTV
jgi:hypothetical protein